MFYTETLILNTGSSRRQFRDRPVDLIRIFIAGNVIFTSGPRPTSTVIVPVSNLLLTLSAAILGRSICSEIGHFSSGEKSSSLASQIDTSHSVNQVNSLWLYVSFSSLSVGISTMSLYIADSLSLSILSVQLSSSLVSLK